MELLLLIVIIVGFTANALFLRSLLKQVSNKISFLVQGEDAPSIPSSQSKEAAPSLPFPPVSGIYKSPFDQPLPNQIGEDEGSLELSEQNLASLPKDVKFEVEGGDVHTPPGFEEAKK